MFIKNTSQQIIVKRELRTRTEICSKTSNRTSSAHSIKSSIGPSNEVRIRRVEKVEERLPKREERPERGKAERELGY